MKCGKVEKGLNCHGWVMGHGWGSHGGTSKMGEWGRNTALEMLHVSRAHVAQTLKCASSCSLKLDMFR